MKLITRDKTRKVSVGGVSVGGGSPVRVQSMTKTDTCDVAATVAEIKRLARAGCEIVRVAVPDIAAAQKIRAIKKRSPLPIVADIHFDHRLALESIKSGADKIRINPGNIAREHMAEIARAAIRARIPIRIGVNVGSLKSAQARGLTVAKKARALARAAGKYCEDLEREGFGDIVVSLKASDVNTTVAAYTEFARRNDYPLHVGITESGPPGRGSIKSAVGIGILLYAGLGDTVRVSLTAEPEKEVEEAYEILRALDLRRKGFDIISCPTCGRCGIDISRVVRRLEEKIKNIERAPDSGRTLKIAVMGCVVNGPGEAREADIGIAAAGRAGSGIFFKGGVPVGKIAARDWVGVLVREAARLARKKT